MVKNKNENVSAVQDLCRKLKIQLDQLAVPLDQTPPLEDKSRRTQLMEQLKRQLNELSR